MTKTALQVLAALVLTCTVASAQASRTGTTFSLGGTPLVYTPDVAYDNVHDRYLTVQGSRPAGFIEGILADANGAVLSQFSINASRGAWAGEYAQNPRVAFAADVNGGAGGYLVTWHETLGDFAQVRGRLVSADGVPLGGDLVISVEAVDKFTSTCWLMGAAIAYSPTSREFLVAWMGSFNVSNDIRFNRVSAAGVVLQSTVTAVTTASPDWERDPAVAYNPDADEFLITYAGYHNALSYAYAAARRVKAGTGALLGSNVEFDATLATYIPAVAYNTASKQYLAIWYHRSSQLAAFYGIKLNADGTPASGLIPESSQYFAYDALDLKYNGVSGDYLLVTHSNTNEDAAVSVKSDGTPYDNGFLATSTANTAGSKGNFNPRLTASTKSGSYLLVTASGFSFVGAQFITSNAGPHVDSPNPMMSVDAPTAGSVSPSFTVGGWATDLGSSTGSGADAVHVWAWPSNGAAPIFVGATTPSESRPDVGALFGSRFSNSGFTLKVSSLPAGSYVLSVYMHSTVTNTFNAVRSVNINVGQPNPYMSIDIPGNGATVPASGFKVGGWAVDFASASGPGMSAVHVWAFPVGGGAPIFAAAATYGGSRPDVGAIFGSQFTNSGYNATVSVLPPGTYDLGVYGLSTVAGTFNVVRFVRVVVQ